MKRKLLTAIIILLFANLYSNAQCIGNIPSNAVVVNATTTFNGGFDPIWVCTPDTLISDGGFHNIFLEPGSVMTTSGGIDTIYVKSGATFFMQGGIHVVYYLSPQDVFFGGGIPTKHLCDSLKFDYKNAPPNGCVATSLPQEFSVLKWPAIISNPVSDVVYFDLSNAPSEIYWVKISNAIGRCIVNAAISVSKNSLDLMNASSGIYYYQIINSKGESKGGKFIIE
jgi:hypothetical protein